MIAPESKPGIQYDVQAKMKGQVFIFAINFCVNFLHKNGFFFYKKRREWETGESNVIPSLPLVFQSIGTRIGRRVAEAATQLKWSTP